VDANLARRTEAEAPDGGPRHAPWAKGSGGNHVKARFRSQALRVLLALVALGSWAMVLEAGRRW
jgi:hypothetical protein